MGSATFTLKKVETFPLVVELDCPLGKGKFTLDCKPKPREVIQALIDNGATVDALFDEVVAAVHGAPGADGSELDGQSAKEFYTTGELANYSMPAFLSAYLEQFGDARRKNGQRLPRR